MTLRRGQIALAFASVVIIAAGALALLVHRQRASEILRSSAAPAPALLTSLYQAEFAESAQAIASTWFEMGDPVRSLTAGARAVPETDDPDFLRKVAAEAVAAEDWALAQAALERLLALNPDDQAHFDLGLLLASTDPERARVHLQIAARVSAQDDLALALETASYSPEMLGRILFERALWPQAEQAFIIAAADLAVQPETLALLALSRDYQAKDGSIWMNRAAVRAPDDPDVLVMQGIHLRLQGDDEGSLQALSAAAALAPGSPAILAQLGAAYQRLGQLSEARRWYEMAQQLARGDLRYQSLVDSIARTQGFEPDALPGFPP